MLVPSETSQYLREQLPEISKSLPATVTMFGVLHALSEFSCKSALAHDYDKLSKCFGAAESLYEQGNGGVKSAVENVYVYSFSRLLTIAATDKKNIQSLMPPVLRAIYMSQVMHRGY